VLDRSEINRALAKAIAYKQAGNNERAGEWAASLVRLLECADILREAPAPAPAPAPVAAGGARRLSPARQPLNRRRGAAFG
jgi:hypothetical protein